MSGESAQESFTEIHESNRERIVQRIVERTYADPVRHASRIALFERCGATRSPVADVDKE